MQYTLSQGLDATDDIIMGLISLYIATEAVHEFEHIPFSSADQLVQPLAKGLLYSAGATWVALRAIRQHQVRKRLSAQRRQSTTSNVDRIFIADQAGLDAILEKTAAREKREWGVVYKVEIRMGYLAVIHSILKPQDCEERGFLSPRGRLMLEVNYTAIEKSGYSGHHHHYHPLGSAFNYFVNKNDRLASARLGSAGMFNLLSFNTSQGPELIGYNLHNIFLPANSTKEELVRATPQEIWKYLEK
jgi:hypothetical protein